ncbi:MAG: hypothetical protein ACSHX8_07970 [Opitutaceae bacterium]
MKFYLVLVALIFMTSSLFSGVDSKKLELSSLSKEPTEGIPYFLPKPVIILETSPVMDKEGKVTAIKVDVKKHTVADRKSAFTLDINNSVFTESKTTVGVSGGLLNSVDYEGESKAAEVIESIATFIFSMQHASALKGQYDLFEGLEPGMFEAFGPRVKVNTIRVDADLDKAALDKTALKGKFTAFVKGRYGDEIFNLIHAMDEDLISDIYAAVRKDLKTEGIVMSFSDIIEGVDAQLLNRQLIYRDLDSLADETVGGRFDVKLSIVYDDPRTQVSTFDATVSKVCDCQKRPRLGQACKACPREVPSKNYKNSILVKTERPAVLEVSVLPNLEASNRLAVSNLVSKLKPVVGVLNKKIITDSSTYNKARGELKDDATAKVDEAKAARTSHFDRLDKWLDNVGSLDDGRSNFNMLIFPTYIELHTAKVKEHLDDAETAKDKAKLLGADFNSFMKGFATDLMKLHIVEKKDVDVPIPAEYSQHSAMVTLPSPEAYRVPIETLAIGKSKTGIKLEQGLIRSVSVDREAPGAELAALPAKVIDPYISLLKELLTIKVNTLAQSDDAIAQEVAMVKLEQELKELQKAPDALDIAHNQSITELTRAKELLALQVAIAGLTPKTPNVDSGQIAHDALVRSLDQQREILRLEQEIAELSN